MVVMRALHKSTNFWDPHTFQLHEEAIERRDVAKIKLLEMRF